MNSFAKQTLIEGQPARIHCLEIDGQTYSLSRGLATIVCLEDEWFDDVRDPYSVIAELKQSPVHADIFTFWQRLPDTQPQFDFRTEWDRIAAVPVTSFDHWWNRQLKPTARNKIRKAEKSGLEVREAVYDDEFVRGMTEVFNETPVRQGRRFWHYGKDLETVRRQFSRYLFREDLLGAYYRDELIGFVMLGNAGKYGVLGQILSKVRHRDKAPNNALIAKAVEMCERRRLPYLVYAYWPSGSLADFKHANGFEETPLPRYYVPLSTWGRVILRLGLHRGWKALLPQQITERLKSARRAWLRRHEADTRIGNRGAD